MLICAAGDIHGAMDRMYDDVLTFEAALGVRFEWVLHVGDFGVWPDPNRILLNSGPVWGPASSRLLVD